jgi:hypothetical protein
MIMGQRYIDHPQPHKRVYYLDQDYGDVLETIGINRNKTEEFHLPKIANGKSNGIIILVESISSDSERKRMIQ